MAFKSLSEWMDEKNSSYYKSVKTKIYSDFSTYAQSEKGMLTRANAMEFYAKAVKEGKEKYSVLEIGVGNGAFASGFLDEISRLDKENKTNICGLINYSLADFSKIILDNAMKKIKLSKNSKNANVNSFLIDASDFQNSASTLGSFDLIRCNELFSDLPANLYSHQGEEISEILLDEKMKPKEVPPPLASLDFFEKKSILAMPDDFFIPINKISAGALSSLSAHLEANGYVDVFDYGFYFKSDFDVPSEMWNLSIVREFGGQWTVDLNFIYLGAFLLQKKNVIVERQKEYVQKITNKKISLDDSKGLDYSEEESEFEEEDFFYHMRIN